MTRVASLPLVKRCLDAYWDPSFGDLTLDHQQRMAAVFALLCKELSLSSIAIHKLMTENPCDPVSQQLRQDFLDWLYDCSGRQDRGDHTYTGLYLEYLESEQTRKANAEVVK